MKRIIIILASTILISLCGFSKNYEKEYKKLIEDYDVASAAKLSDKDNPAAFWNIAISCDTHLEKFQKDMKKGKGAEKDAAERYALIPRFYSSVNESVVTELQNFCDSVIDEMGIREAYPSCSLHIINSNEARAFSAPSDSGFVMCVTTGLMYHKGVTPDILKGYVAHEFARGALQQRLRKLYLDAKKERKDLIIAGIVAGVGVGALIAIPDDDAYNYADAWDSYNIYSTAKNTEEILQQLKKLPKAKISQYDFDYGDKLDAEADLFALRFMQYCGQEEDYIKGLQILGSLPIEMDNDTSYYRDIQSRINFINFVKDNPRLKRVVKVN